ncbi:MAG: hypothetical protein IKL48_00025 [Elusimicrobiaceae bacterium]|nr:hypothetical protein [Elusimicrobiaceae bacterium]
MKIFIGLTGIALLVYLILLMSGFDDSFLMLLGIIFAWVIFVAFKLLCIAVYQLRKAWLQASIDIEEK